MENSNAPCTVPLNTSDLSLAQLIDSLLRTTFCFRNIRNSVVCLITHTIAITFSMQSVMWYNFEIFTNARENNGLDYCSSLLFGCTNDLTLHFQRSQNYAARVILRLPKSSSISTHLKLLHWPPVKVRST